MSEIVLDINNLCFSYEGRDVLEDVKFNIKRGEIITLLGPSGTGKTTLFKILTGRLSPFQGSFSILGKCLPEAMDTVSYMTQEDLLLPWRTVWHNLVLPFELGKKKHEEYFQEEADSVLDELGLGDSKNLYPDELSGGMRQRVSLARSLIQKKPLILLDEPFTGLDLLWREQFYSMLRKLREKYRLTILLVTHDFHDAFMLSDRILLLSKGSIQAEWQISEKDRHNMMTYGIYLDEMRTALMN